jgi:hypothetical protein
MLTLRYHNPNAPLAYGTKSDYGWIIAEASPIERTINIDYRPTRMVFPYVLFCSHYFNKHTPYTYFNHQLRVCFANQPFTSFKNLVFQPATNDGFGNICTPHAFDNKIFRSPEEFISNIAGLWWQTVHRGCWHGWRYVTMQNVLKTKWCDYKGIPFREAMYLPKSGFRDSEIIDKVIVPKVPRIK